MPAATATTDADDDRVRVTTWSFDGPGDATGHHVHEYDYVVVPVTGGRFAVTGIDGSVREMHQLAGKPYLGTAGTAHDVSCVEGGAVFVEVELKS